MNLHAQLTRVQHAEQALDSRRADSAQHVRQLIQCWRNGWTPGRIVVAGLATGFVAGCAQPLRMAGNGGLLNLLQVLAKLFPELQDSLTTILGSADTHPPAPAETP